ncbi:MAG: DUF4139 domain-containing protein [Cyanobacteria bacterium SZAS LIN-2]|nr:DUF4139 domain-containing protein [Cyanobacteria bacterium SZAS LIN-2]
MADKPAVSSDSKDVSITIYNQNFGLVRDVREIMFKDGRNNIKFDDVAAGIDPTTVSFISLTAPNSVAVREQNYQFDLMDINTILKRSVGREVKFRQFIPGGGERSVEGTLLSPPSASVADSNGNVSEQAQSIVVKTSSGIVVAPQGQLELAELPKGLVAKPSLLWKIDCEKAGQQKAEISYQTQGLNWKCDYVAVDNADDSGVDITSWVTLDNKSGATYNDAALKLIAGDVHKVQNAQPMMERAMAMDGAAAAAPQQFSEQSFAEYHLYSLAGRTDLHDNETKQMTLFTASAVPVKKLFIFEPSGPFEDGSGGDDSKVKVKLEMVNSKENNMGMALPKGKVRVYKRDADSALQFIGEDAIDHTAKDEKVRLEIGNAFDVVGGFKQTSFNDGSSFGGKVQKATYEVSLRNHKDAPVTVTFVGHAGGDWKITTPSTPFTKKNSTTYEFTVPVAKNGETKITYTVETRYQ